jgi:hypothetical protein
MGCPYRIPIKKALWAGSIWPKLTIMIWLFSVSSLTSTSLTLYRALVSSISKLPFFTSRKSFIFLLLAMSPFILLGT